MSNTHACYALAVNSDAKVCVYLYIPSVRSIKYNLHFLLRFVSVAAAMATLLSGTCTTNGKCRRFKATPTVPAASTFHRMEQNCGQVCT